MKNTTQVFDFFEANTDFTQISKQPLNTAKMPEPLKFRYYYISEAVKIVLKHVIFINEASHYSCEYGRITVLPLTKKAFNISLRGKNKQNINCVFRLY